MQWDDSENAGFTTGLPWKRVNPNYTEINVATQDGDPNSVLNHFRKMTRLRNDNLVLVYGDYDLILDDHDQIYAYTRTLNDDNLLVIMNFSDERANATLPNTVRTGEIMINNYSSEPFKDNSQALLEPYQAVVVRLQKR